MHCARYPAASSTKCEGAGYLTTTGAAKVATAGAAKVATSGAAKVIAESGNPESFGLHGQVDEAGFYAPVMANRRTEMHQLEELVRLHRMGTGAREVARLLGISPTTERAYRHSLEASELLEGSPEALPSLERLKTAVQKHQPERSTPAHEISSIAEWEATVEELVKKGMTPRPIYDRLRQEESDRFEGSYWSVKRMVRRLRREQGISAQEVAIRVHTEPGAIAQVDFGYVGKLLCPEEHVLRRAWVFVMTLGYSRHMYAEVVFNQKSTTWIALHQRAFRFFGGAPETLVPDNLKAAVIRAAFAVDDDSELNRSYRELARHYGFKIDPAPPYQPRKKGKVESSVKYVKRNALAGRDGEEINLVNRALRWWLENTAGARTHGTTGKQPLRVFIEEEQAALRALPAQSYEEVIWKKAKVHTDTHIAFDRRMYSVPWRWVGHHVWVRATPSTVAIFGEDVRIATHSRTGKGRWSTIEAHLPEHRRDGRHRSRSHWEARASAIGPETAGLVNEVFESDDVLSQLRKVQAIIKHLEDFPVERAEAASRRARYYGTYSYRGVKAILAKALDMEALPQVLLPTDEPDQRPRFARNLSELVAAKLGDSHEPH